MDQTPDSPLTHQHGPRGADSVSNFTLSTFFVLSGPPLDFADEVPGVLNHVCPANGETASPFPSKPFHTTHLAPALHPHSMSTKKGGLHDSYPCTQIPMKIELSNSPADEQRFFNKKGKFPVPSFGLTRLFDDEILQGYICHATRMWRDYHVSSCVLVVWAGVRHFLFLTRKFANLHTVLDLSTSSTRKEHACLSGSPRPRWLVFRV